MRAWRSIASARSSFLLLLVASLPSPAQAQQLRVAVIPVEGPQGDKATAALVKAVKKASVLVSHGEWEAAAKKLFATSHSASDLSAVAGDLAVQVVVTGKVKKGDGGWELSLSVRHGPTGKSAVKLKYPLKGPRLDPVTLRKIGDDVPPALDTAAAGPGAGEGAEGPETPGTPGEAAANPSTENENPLASEAPAPAEPVAERPAWAPYFDASFGFVLAGRVFGFDEDRTPSFRSTVVPGIQLDANVYPLAFLAARRTAGPNLASGLGLGVTWGIDFWKPVSPCYGPVDATGTCTIPTIDQYGTNEYRYEVGLRWKWNAFRQADNRPEFLFNAQYGLHSFSVQRRSYINEGGERDIGPPNVQYTYVTLGLGLRFPFARQFAASAGFNYHIVTDAGPIHTTGEWGPGGTSGVRLSAGFEYRFWKGLFARLTGSFERFGLSFDQPPMKHNTMPPCPCGTTGGASDVFYNFVLGAGYTY